MHYLTSKEWWERAGIRAIKTAAETAAAMLVGGVVLSDIDWPYVVSATVLAAIVSLLFSLKGLPEVDNTETEE